MADPRSFLNSMLGSSSKSISTSNALSAMTEFCQAVNPNNSAASRVGAGLKSLVSVSKAMGKGGKLPATIDNASSNAKWVLGMVGIDSQQLFKAGQGQVPMLDAMGNAVIDPVTGQPQTRNMTIAEAATAAATGVFNKVKNGQFTINDIPLFRPPLEAGYRAIKMDTRHTFGAAINKEVINIASNSPYAMDLDKAALPKYKFLFVVQFTFNAPYMQDGKFQQHLAFVVKKSTRPGIKYDMEDVNYYNFRTKTATKAELEEMSMTFYDDNRNSAAGLYSAYTRAMSPVLNYKTPAETMAMENQGITLNTAYAAANVGSISGGTPHLTQNSGSTAALIGDNKTIINNIKLYHIYDNGRKVNTYTFMNPRITSFDLDDVDMQSSDVNFVELKFNYETVYTELGEPMAAINFEDLTRVGDYPLHWVGDDVSSGALDYNSTTGSRIKRAGCIDDASSTARGLLGGLGSIFSPGSNNSKALDKDYSEAYAEMKALSKATVDSFNP